MKKLAYQSVGFCIAVLAFSCNNASTTKQEKPAVKETTAAAAEKPAQPEVLKGDYCFQKALNRDTTTVRVRILSSDDIRGEMTWSPWQKDGAYGTLTGKMNAANEMELMYKYQIEGSNQTETKIMKIENNKLSIKRGELMDPKNDGNSVFKDATKAVFTEVLDKISCQ